MASTSKKSCLVIARGSMWWSWKGQWMPTKKEVTRVYSYTKLLGPYIFWRSWDSLLYRHNIPQPWPSPLVEVKRTTLHSGAHHLLWDWLHWSSREESETLPRYGWGCTEARILYNLKVYALSSCAVFLYNTCKTGHSLLTPLLCTYVC